MATKKKWVPAYQRPVVDGIGFNPKGEAGTHIVVVERPLSGLTFVGPFITQDAAHKWVHGEGLAYVWGYFGDATEIEGVKFHVRWVDVPRKEED